tara:strand:- start:375 stop:641 length:267 start_codon:yes stop_codon:yes gene_type:complete
MAYKGVLPSDLWDRYDQEGGQDMLSMDLLVAMEMSERIEKATVDSKKKMDGNSAAARREQRIANRQLLNDNEGVDMLRGLGVPMSKRE